MFLSSIFLFLLAQFATNSIQQSMDRSSFFVAQAASQALVRVDTTKTATTEGTIITIPTPTATPIPTIVVPTPTLAAKPTETPALTVSQVKPATPASAYESLFDQYSSQYGVDKETMKTIARCESGFNPTSRNGTYGGMFQFAQSTWISTRNQMGLDTNPDIRFSAADAIQAAAFKISHGGISAWSGCL